MQDIYVIDDNSNINDILKIIAKKSDGYKLKNIKTGEIENVLEKNSSIIVVSSNMSPLTGLPGNIQIHSELKKNLENNQMFSVLYLDLDNFKAYNDVYGFLKGDNIIKYTADIILRVIQTEKFNNAFVGHIGGDDFVVIVQEDNIEKLCQSLIASFDANVNKFFSKEDIKRGYLEVENRKGVMEQFPLTSISIGVVICEPNRFKNILEIGEIGAQLKHTAKTVMGSSYAIDRRKEKRN